MGGILALADVHDRGAGTSTVDPARRGRGGAAGERRVAARLLRERGERGAGVRRADQGHVDAAARSAARCRRRSRCHSGAPASVRRVHARPAKTYFASTPATVTSTAGDALLSVSDPSLGRTPATWSTARSSCPSRSRPGPATPPTPAPPTTTSAATAEPADLERPGLQRRGDDRVQAARQGQRPAAHGHVRQDADVHAVHDQPVTGQTLGAPVGAPSGKSHTSRRVAVARIADRS